MDTVKTDFTATEQHLFSENEMVQFEPASTGQRFVNYLLDNLVMQFGISFVTGFVLAKLLLALSPDTAYAWFGGESLGVSYLIGLVNYLLYYTVCEKVFRGYTLGKLVTGTRAVREDGADLTWKDAFLRSLSRMVPFEPFSIWFGSGMWHDTWTKTRVIKMR